MRAKRGDLAVEETAARSQSPHGTEVLGWSVKVYGLETVHLAEAGAQPPTRTHLEGDGMLREQNLSVGKGGRKVDV